MAAGRPHGRRRLLLFGTLTVDVDRERVQVVFGIGLIRKTVRLADIAAFQPVRNPWIAGWGIRAIRGGMLWNVSGLDAVELALRDGRFFRIGTDEPEALARAIQAATGRAPSDTRAGVASGLPPAPKRSPYFFYIVGAIVLLGVALALLPVIVQMKPPVVTVHADGFDVKSPFYGQGYRADDITTIEILDRLPVRRGPHERLLGQRPPARPLPRHAASAKASCSWTRALRRGSSSACGRGS